MENDPIIVIKSYPDAIYDKSSDSLYFKKLQSITSIFIGITDLYKEATQEDTEEFLNKDFISLKADFDASKVKTANRKRIAMAMDTLSKFNSEEKDQIFEYIKEYCDDISSETTEKVFEIESEDNLKNLLYGIEQRFYTTPLGNEKRLANSISVVNK